MPAMLRTIWLARPRAMNPAPINPTRIGLPCSSRARSAVSTRILLFLSTDAHPGFEVFFDLRQGSPSTVFVGNDGDGQGPLQVQARIVERQAAFGPWRIELANVIGRFRVVR